MLWQSLWFWLVLAAVLAIAETILPGFILLGFAIGAVLTAGLLWQGITGGSLPVVLLVWAAGSALGWVGLKLVFTRPQHRPKIWTRDINDDE